MDKFTFNKTSQWKINKFFTSFSINNFLLLTTTKELINQKVFPEENNKSIIPFISKEKSFALLSFLTLYAEKFKNKTILMSEQIHSNRVIYVKQQDTECFSSKLQVGEFVFSYKLFLKTDGIITDSLDDIIVIFTADCIPLFIIDNKNKIFGLLHIGRKGLQLGIIENLLKKLSLLPHFSLKDTVFVAGPHICEKCYIVDGKNFSLFNLLYNQLTFFNIRPSQIFNSHICTFHNKKFFSYRRDATEHRMLSIISYFCGS